MKRKIIIVICVLLSVFMFSACSSSSKSGEASDPAISSTSKAKTLTSVSNDATELWNNVICEVSWYSKNGTSATGKALDIDFVIQTMDKYYNKLKEDKTFIDSLGDEYSDIKTSFDKMLDKATIICDNLRKETPKANVELAYKEEIDLFHQYYSYFYDSATEKKA